MAHKDFILLIFWFSSNLGKLFLPYLWKHNRDKQKMSSNWIGIQSGPQKQRQKKKVGLSMCTKFSFHNNCKNIDGTSQNNTYWSMAVWQLLINSFSFFVYLRGHWMKKLRDGVKSSEFRLSHMSNVINYIWHMDFYFCWPLYGQFPTKTGLFM